MNHTPTTSFRRTTIAMAVMAASLVAADASYAQKQLEEVVVTAQKREEGANDVGITINAFTGDQIRDFGVATAEDIAQMTPGLTVNETAATGVPLYTIRGVGFQDYSTGSSSTVGLYFDEVAMPYTVMTRGLVFDQQRVEVLKGPQGDLFGANTTAGSINFISNKPTQEFEAGIIASYGRYETTDVEGYVSGGSDFVQGRLALKTVQSNEGWQESTTSNDKLGEQDTTALRGIVNFDFSEDLRLMLIGQYSKDDSDNRANTPYNGTIIGLNEFAAPYQPLNEYILPGGANFGETPPWYSTGDNKKAGWTNKYTSAITGETWNIRPKRDNELKGGSARVDYEFNDLVLTSITGYNDFTRTEANDWDGGFYNDSSNINKTDLWVFSQEFRLAGEVGDVNWLTGVYYTEDRMKEYYHYFMSDSVYGYGSIPFGVELFAPTPILELDTKYKQQTESAAIYGHVEWQFADAWRLTLGARYTHETRQWQGCTFVADDGSLANFLNAQFGSTLGPGDCGTIDDMPNSPTYIFNVIGTPDVNDAFHVYKDTIDTKKGMGKVGLDYSLDEDILLYGSVSQGFKSGGFNGANSNTTQQLIPYQEETLTAYEIGSKATLLDNTMQLNLAGFYYDYKDKQEQDLAVTFVGNISGLTNVPKSELWGAEMDLQWLPTDNLTLNAAVAWLDTDIKKWEAVSSASVWPNTVYEDASGYQLAQSPEWSYTAMAKYEWPLGDNLVLDVSADVTYTDETNGSVRVEEYTDSYTILGARAGIAAADGSWKVMAWGRNLTDEDYYPSAYQGGNGPYVRVQGMPMTYGVTVSYFYQ
jgi:iron complex outermembrane receptor protein